jgi:hypothetical protein
MGSTVEMLVKQNEVRALYMTGDWTNKEIALKSEVSEQSVSDWSQKFKWKEAREFRLKREALIKELENVDIDYVLKSFVDFIQSKYPYLKAQWGFYIDEFKESLKL